MTVTINVNGLTLCHRGSEGVTHNTLPDICKTPKKGKPKPFDNEAYSKDLADGTTTVFADGGHMIANFGSIFATSIYDEGGSLGGIISGTHLAEADFITHSFDVFLEGKPACRLTDKMWMNHRNTVNMAGLWQKELPPSLVEQICIAICLCREKSMPTATEVGEVLERVGDAVRGVSDTTKDLPSAVNETHRRQSCFADQFNAEGKPWYGTTPKDPSVLTEVPYRIPDSLIKSKTGRTTYPGGPTSPGSVQRALNQARGNAGTVVIWDMVLLKNPALPADGANVKNYIEVKFKGDKWTTNQDVARRAPSVKSKLLRVDEADCACGADEQQRQREIKRAMEKSADNAKKVLPLLMPPGVPGFPGRLPPIAP